MNALTKALSRSDGVLSTAHAAALQLRAAGALPLAPADGLGALGHMRDRSGDRQRYSLFRGWLYDAINALASEGAGQPVEVGRLAGARPKEGGPKKKKSVITRAMPPGLRRKAAREEYEVVADHPLVDLLERPNSIQSRWQLVYCFIANLQLTGWSFLVGGKTKDGFEVYSVPTTWMHPIHDKGPFAEFKVQNPRNPSSGADQKPLTRDQVAFAHLPNPSDPLSALAPAAAKMSAIRIDDHIQASQEAFFENGIFPSVIVTMGKDPHPDVAGGLRPRLSGVQRRQVIGAIRKAMGGVANYGNPAIVDGLIESIERLSATANEMGWDKSEDKIRARILAAFGVHPFILGEPVSVGGYAQAAIIQERFCRRVNTYLEMLGGLMTNWLAPIVSPDDALEVWWEPAAPVDPSLESGNMKAARASNDISQNEYRAYLGLPPDEDRNESVISEKALPQVLALVGQLGQGAVDEKQAQAILRGMGLPDDLAKQIARKPPPKPEQPAPGGPPGAPPQGPPGAPQTPPGEEGAEAQESETEAALAELRKATEALGRSMAETSMPETLALDILMRASGIKHGQHDQSTHGRGRKPSAGGQSQAAGSQQSSGSSQGKPSAKVDPKGDLARFSQAPLGSLQNPIMLESAERPGRQYAPPNRSRQQSLQEAQKQGFKPTSRDKWINEQQGIEYLAKRDAAATVTRARKAGYKPTSNDDVIQEMQARVWLASGGKVDPKGDLSRYSQAPLGSGDNPILLEAVEGKATTPNDLIAAVRGQAKSLDQVQRFVAKLPYSAKRGMVSNADQMLSDLGDWWSKNDLGKGTSWQEAAASVERKILTDDAISARLWAVVQGEKFGEAKDAGDMIAKHLPGQHSQATHGRGGGGGKAPPATEAKLAKYEKEFGEFKGKPARKAQTAAEKRNGSMHEHTTESGDWTPERKALHQAIVDHHFRGLSPAEGQPVATFLGGGSASGKTTMLKSGGVDIPKGAVHVDPDEIKHMLPEFAARTRAGDMTSAAWAHEESSYLAKQVHARALREGYHSVLDGTGDSSIDKLASKVQAARDAGHRTVARYATIDTDTAVKISMKRAAETGREVPESDIRQIHSAVSRIVPEAVSRGLFDDLRVYDNNERGNARLAASASGSSLTVRDAGLWQRFLDKAE